MTQRRSPSDRTARIVAIRASLREKSSETQVPLGNPSTPPVCIQARAGTKPVPVVHGRTRETAEFPVNPRYLADMIESMGTIQSPTHLPGSERPNGIRLTQPETIGGQEYATGAVLIVEGGLRIAAAWHLGWRMIPARIVSGTAWDVALLATVSNTKAVQSARSPEDVRNKMLLFRETHGRLPTVPETMDLCRVSRRTVYRVRERFADDLGIEPRETTDPKAHKGPPPMTDAHLTRIAQS